jgi:hypothetical protein
MIIILGLIILVAAVVVGAAGVLGNGGTHGFAHRFSVLNSDRHPAPDDGGGSRLHLFGPRSAA